MLVAADSFDRSNSQSLGAADTGGAWVATGSTWFGVSNGVALTVSGKQQGAVLLNAGTADASIESTVTLSSQRAAPGLSLRAHNAANQLAVTLVKRNGEDRAVLTKIDGGTSSELAGSLPLGLVGGSSYRLRADVDGSVVRVFVDDRLVLEHVLTAADVATFGTRTGFGLTASRVGSGDDGSSTWDDVTITTR